MRKFLFLLTACGMEILSVAHTKKWPAIQIYLFLVNPVGVRIANGSLPDEGVLQFGIGFVPYQDCKLKRMISFASRVCPWLR